MARRRSLHTFVILYVIWLSVGNAGRAGWVPKLRGTLQQESKTDLFIEALPYLDQHANQLNLDRLIEAFAKNGDPILAPTGDPVIYPEGSIKTTMAKEDISNKDKLLLAYVEAELTVSERTTHRFLIRLISMEQKDGKMQLSSSTSGVGVIQTKRMKIGTGLKTPGRHEVLHILIARPILGSSPAKILDVAKSVVDVPQP